MPGSESSLITVFNVGLLLNGFNREAERNTGMSIVQWCVLNRMLEMPASPAQRISEALGVHPSTLTQTLKRLRKRGLIHVAQDPRDSRKKLISVTRRGFESLERTRGEMILYEKGLRAVAVKLQSIESHLKRKRVPRTSQYFVGSKGAPEFR